MPPNNNLYFKAVVSYNNCLSEVHEIYSGVPQGSILGPLLFLVFFNDITDVVNHSKVIKYADDTVLYVADKQTQSIQAKLDKDMESIAGWLKENELIINLKKGKTESLLFGTAKRRSMQTEPLEVSVPCPTRTTITSTSDYKYLGVHVDGSLSLSSQFEKSFKKASGRLRLLLKIRDPARKAKCFVFCNAVFKPQVACIPGCSKTTILLVSRIGPKVWL